ncbi:MAG: addiction module toxin RelE [Neptuniibacter caesariensis]|uniref:Addiction module toxin RelE n=1 Tax=Neptuniibacter caesariensis TaxID=207954 RepID=A0A2G6JBP8_NEPCE|nr:MAG: addiction module toxin RelE [Neptuniibacter caesariensis]
MSISFSKSAIDDLDDIKAYYLEKGVPQIGQGFVAAIVEHVETLATHPEIGRVVPEFGDDAIRELIHSPFRIVYLYQSESVNIIRVWRSERLLKLSEN